MSQVVMLTRRLPADAAEALSHAGCSLRQIEADGRVSRTELLATAAGCHGVIAVLSDLIDAEFLDAAGPSLRVVANFAVGYENLDLAACTARGVWATNTPDVLTEATADLTWALILATTRRLIEGERLARSGAWQGWTPTQLLGVELQGATLGIVGAGRIGSAVGRRGAAFGMSLIYASPRPSESLDRLGARRLGLDELLGAADVVSLHAPMRPENRRLIDAERLARFKRSAVLINTARGALVDEIALAAALKSGGLAAAGLDVYEHEPRITPDLLQLPNVVLLPHLGSATRATRGRMADLAAQNVIDALQGRAPRAALNRVLTKINSA